MQQQLSRNASGLRRLWSKMRKRTDSIQHRSGETVDDYERLGQQVESSVPEIDKYSEHFSYYRGEGCTADHDSTEISHTQVFDVQDYSDEVLDNDAVELNTTDPELIAEIAEESRLRRDNSKMIVANTDTKSEITVETPKANHSTAIHVSQNVCSYPHCTISPKAPARWSLHALDAYNSDPVPYNSVCHEVIYMAMHQLANFDLTSLNGQRCLQQHFRGLRTLRYDMGVNSDKFACEGCTMTPGRVCMRWLGADAFVILPLVPKFRDQLVGSKEVGYWVWDGR